MATTEDDLLERVTSVCVDAGHYRQATDNDFAKQPIGSIDGAVTVGLVGLSPTGGMNFTEVCRAMADIGIARLVNEDHHAARKTLLADARTLVAALVRDGAQVSGEYAVDDGGRTVVIEAQPGASYLVARVRVPINFEAEL